MPTYKKFVLWISATTILIWLINIYGIEIFSIQTAYAQASSTRPDQLLNDTFFLVGTILGFFHWLTLNLIHLMELFLDPNNFIEIYDSSGKNPLHEIWMISRDIMNIIFAFLLIAGGVITIITAKKDMIMQNLPKFILSVVLINFSWFFPRVILDVSNVLTATVYSLPSNINIKCQIKDDSLPPPGLRNCSLWKNVKFNVNEEDVDMFEDDGYECIQSMGSYTCFQTEEMNADANSPNAIMIGLILNHGRILDLARIRRSDPPPPPGAGAAPLGSNQIQELLRSLIQIGFAFILIIAIFFPLAAMLVVFVIRILFLWITIAFMPFMFLGFLVGDKMGKMNTMELIWKNFITSAFLPFIVAIPFTIGFILLNTGVNLMSTGGINLSDFDVPQNFMIGGLETFLDLLWLIMSIVVIWVGTFAALSINETYGKVAGTIKGWGESWGKLGASLPLRVPWIPVHDSEGNRTNASINAFRSHFGPSGINNALQNDTRQEVNRIWGNDSGTSGADLNNILNNHADRANITNNLANNFDIINNFNPSGATPAQITAVQNAVHEIESNMRRIVPDANTSPEDMAEFARDFGTNTNNINQTLLEQINNL